MCLIVVQLIVFLFSAVSKAVVMSMHSDVQRLLNTEVTTHIRTNLIAWYRLNRRRMPWRGDDTPVPVSPYSVWVSEVMLQQTRVDTVINYWNKWMEKFPTVTDLAHATPDEVNQLWAGLGYYRRAQNLLKGAKYVVDKYQGVMPGTAEELLTIPGIGPYTAGAISSIAFKQREPVVDGNVLRVFSRLFALRDEVGGGKMEKLSWKLAATLVDPETPSEFNQAIMELGALICSPTSPKCDVCPVRQACAAFRIINRPTMDSALLSLPAADVFDIENHPIPSSVQIFPFKKEKKKAKDLIYLVAVYRHRSSPRDDWKYLMVRRPDKGLLANQWEFPSSLVMEVGGRSITKTKKTKQKKAAGGGSGILGVDTVGNGNDSDDNDNVDDGDDQDDESSNHDDDNGVNDSGASQFAAQQWGQLWTHQSTASKLQSEFVTHTAVQSFVTHLRDRCGRVVQRDEEQGFVMDNTWTKADNVEVLRAKTSCYVSEPIVHIFSHEKHTMYVMVEDVEMVVETPPDEVRLKTGRSEAAWRTESDMVTAGITTGVKKILAAIQAAGDGKSGKETRKRSSVSVSASALAPSLPSTSTSGTRTKRCKSSLSSPEDTTTGRTGSALNLEKFLFKEAAPSKSATASATCPPPQDVEVIDLVD